MFCHKTFVESPTWLCASEALHILTNRDTSKRVREYSLRLSNRIRPVRRFVKLASDNHLDWIQIELIYDQAKQLVWLITKYTLYWLWHRHSFAWSWNLVTVVFSKEYSKMRFTHFDSVHSPKQCIYESLKTDPTYAMRNWIKMTYHLGKGEFCVETYDIGQSTNLTCEDLRDQWIKYIVRLILWIHTNAPSQP